MTPFNIPTASWPGLLDEKSREVTVLSQWMIWSGHWREDTWYNICNAELALPGALCCTEDDVWRCGRVNKDRDKVIPWGFWRTNSTPGLLPGYSNQIHHSPQPVGPARESRVCTGYENAHNLTEGQLWISSIRRIGWSHIILVKVVSGEQSFSKVEIIRALSCCRGLACQSRKIFLFFYLSVLAKVGKL